MKVRIGGLEIIDPTMEELDALIERYGGGEVAAPGADAPPKVAKNASTIPGAGTADAVILKHLVDAGATGFPVKALGENLGRGGKAMRGAARDWAKRIGLVNESNLEPFEECRVGTARGLRIKPSLLELARQLLSKA